jgi:hypothetical protein
MAAELPTKRWREEMEEGDDLFTEEGIAAVDQVLRDYAARLEALGPNAPSVDLLAAMKTAVLALNEIGGLDGRFDSFIETSEREELCLERSPPDHETPEPGESVTQRGAHPSEPRPVYRACRTASAARIRSSSVVAATCALSATA